LAAIEESRQRKWERNRRGREAGERAWRAANERHPERRVGAPMNAPVASFWRDEPGQLWTGRRPVGRDDPCRWRPGGAEGWPGE